jgi:SAM-dependent methyltransferase
VANGTLQAPATVDWTESLQTEFGRSFRKALRSLDIESLQRFPPPKAGGLPFGHELRILRRFLSGNSSMLDQSGISAVYRSLATPRQRLLYRAVVVGDPLSHGEWSQLVPGETVASWTAATILVPTATGALQARFRTIAASGLILIVDPFDETFRFRVHIGQDSLNMAEFLNAHDLPSDARCLDVGTGSGILLMKTARGRGEGVGVDINPRAVRVASFNTELNDLHNCAVELRDIFESTADLGQFDVITWNTPFMFFPESWKETSVDGYGGHLGIEIPLKFVDVLPTLLKDNGRAFVLAAGPRMTDGSNRLDIELQRRARPLGVNVVTHVLQTFWVPGLRDFYVEHGVRNFESVMLEVTRGPGRFHRREPPLATAAADILRGLMYRGRS